MSQMNPSSPTRNVVAYLPHPYALHSRPDTESEALDGFVRVEDKLQRVQAFCQANNLHIAHVLCEGTDGVAFLPQRRGLCSLLEMLPYGFFDAVVVDQPLDLAASSAEMDWLRKKLGAVEILSVAPNEPGAGRGDFFVNPALLEELHRVTHSALTHEICFADAKLQELPRGFMPKELAAVKARQLAENPQLPSCFHGTDGEFFPQQYALEVEVKRCFLNCRCCFHRTQPGSLRPARMSLELFRKLVDYIPPQAAQGMVVSLTASGETLAVPDLPAMLRYLSDQRPACQSHFASNGVLLEGDLARRILDTGIQDVLISLNAADADDYRWFCGVDAFDKVSRNIEAFVSLRDSLGLKRPWIRTQIFGLKRWQDKIPAFLDRWAGVVDHVQVTPTSFVPGDLELENLDAIKPESFPATGVCSFLFNFLQVSADGSIWPCCAPAWGSGRLTALGNANQVNPFEVWSSQAYHRLRELNLSGRAVMDECRTCDRRIVDGFEDSVIRATWYRHVLRQMQQGR